MSLNLKPVCTSTNMPAPECTDLQTVTLRAITVRLAEPAYSRGTAVMAWRSLAPRWVWVLLASCEESSPEAEFFMLLSPRNISDLRRLLPVSLHMLKISRGKTV